MRASSDLATRTADVATPRPTNADLAPPRRATGPCPTLATCVALAALAACSASPSAEADPAAPRRTGAAGDRAAPPHTGEDDAPVVVELFTSQGCSSCPPADRLLSTVARDGVIAGRAVVPLAFHVDYWDDLGWADPFSAAAWSERQGRYAAQRGTTRVFTPEAVIAGAADALGSDRAALADAIAAAPPQRRVAARATRTAAGLRVSATAPADADVWVAVWEDGLVTSIRRGENAGARAVDDRIVRRLVRVAPAGATATIDVPIDAAWQHLGAVALAQRSDLAIVGATVLVVGDPPPAATR